MLILTRKPGESVIIEDSVRITVLEVRGSQVKLGIQAPPEVRVNREEVLERQRAEEGLPPALDPPLEAVRSRPGRRFAGGNHPGGDASRTSPSSRAESRRSPPAGRPPRGNPPSGQPPRGNPPSGQHPHSSRPHPSPRHHSAASGHPPVTRRPGPFLHSHDIEPEELEPLPETMRRYRLPEGRRFGRRSTGRTTPGDKENFPPDAEIGPLVDDAERERRSPGADLPQDLDPRTPLRPRSKPADGSEAA